MLPSGGVGVKTGKFSGVKSKTDIYDKEYKTDCEFYTDVLLKNGVPRDSITCEDRSGHTRDNAFMSRELTNANGHAFKMALLRRFLWPSPLMI